MPALTRIKNIGYIQTFKAISSGLLIAYVVMAVMAGPFWIFQIDYFPSILFALTMIYIAGYFFGGLAAVWMSRPKSPSVFIGIICGFLIVVSAIFMGSLVGFFVKVYTNDGTKLSEEMNDYIFKPVELVIIFGSLPIIILGIWLGISIKKRLRTIIGD